MAGASNWILSEEKRNCISSYWWTSSPAIRLTWVFNILFFLAGLVDATVAFTFFVTQDLSMWDIMSFVQALDPQNRADVPLIAISAISLVTIVYTIVGFVALYRRSVDLIHWYIVMVVILFVMQVFAYYKLFRFRNNLDEPGIMQNVNLTFWTVYDERQRKEVHNHAKDVFRIFQTSHKCCGVHNVSDLRGKTFNWGDNDDEYESLPRPCCKVFWDSDTILNHSDFKDCFREGEAITKSQLKPRDAIHLVEYGGHRCYGIVSDWFEANIFEFRVFGFSVYFILFLQLVLGAFIRCVAILEKQGYTLECVKNVKTGRRAVCMFFLRPVDDNFHIQQFQNMVAQPLSHRMSLSSLRRTKLLHQKIQLAMKREADIRRVKAESARSHSIREKRRQPRLSHP